MLPKVSNQEKEQILANVRSYFRSVGDNDPVQEILKCLESGQELNQQQIKKIVAIVDVIAQLPGMVVDPKVEKLSSKLQRSYFQHFGSQVFVR